MAIKSNSVLFVKATPTMTEDQMSHKKTRLSIVSRLSSVGHADDLNASPRRGRDPGMHPVTYKPLSVIH